MDIRKLREADLPALAALYKQFKGDDSSLEAMRATFARIADSPDYAVLVAEVAGRLAGSAMGIVCAELYGQCRPFLVIEDVIVDADHRRLGVGTALMNALEDFARATDCHYMMLVTDADRTWAHNFYASLGFGRDTHRGFKKRLP